MPPRMRVKRFPDWLTWILHGLIFYAAWRMFQYTHFSPAQQAGLLTAMFFYMVDREEFQEGYRHLDDYMDLVGPFGITGWAWLVFFGILG